jgi:hypothetical protein
VQGTLVQLGDEPASAFRLGAGVSQDVSDHVGELDEAFVGVLVDLAVGSHRPVDLAVQVTDEVVDLVRHRRHDENEDGEEQ